MKLKKIAIGDKQKGGEDWKEERRQVFKPSGRLIRDVCPEILTSTQQLFM
jgi:hypothetical protein